MDDHTEIMHREWRMNVERHCDHEWQPVSMVFETQLLDASGRVIVRQPDLRHGRCYMVCVKCCGHTYIETAWVEYYLDGPSLRMDHNVEYYE